MQFKVEELHQMNEQLQDQNTLLRAQLSTGTNIVPEYVNVLQTAPQLDDKLISLENENREKGEELERLRKDQEDLLELLTDQDLKLNSFKNRLRELGENIDDGDSDNNSVSSDIEIEA